MFLTRPTVELVSLISGAQQVQDTTETVETLLPTELRQQLCELLLTKK